METLRFVMVSTYYPPRHLGGDAVFVKYLTQELARQGHEVHILTSPGAYALLRRSCSQEGEPSNSDGIVHPSDSAFPRMRTLAALSLGMQGRISMELDDIMKNIGPDVVHWHNTKGFIGQPYAAKHAATIYTAHDYYLICPRSNLLRPDLSTCHGPYNCLSCHLRWMKPLPLWRSGSRRVVRLDRRIAVVSPSEFLARRLCQDGITVTRVIRNFTPDLSRRSATGNADENLILYAGMLEPHKGLNTLIRGFAMSASTHGFRLVITGEGSMKEHLSRLITDLGVSDRVDLLGFVSRHDLNALRSRARFQAIPSEWPENSPLTAIEALSHEVPLIVSDQGGLPEIANPGGGSLTFKGGNPASLSATLADAWISLGRVEDMRRKARCRYEELFTAKRHLADYLDLVRNLQCGG